MINEKKAIMKAKLETKEIKTNDKFNIFYENLMIFYYNMLNKTSKNLWLICSSIIFQYLHLISFILYQNVSLKIYIFSLTLF